MLRCRLQTVQSALCSLKNFDCYSQTNSFMTYHSIDFNTDMAKVPYSVTIDQSSCFRERDSLLGFLYSFRTGDLAGESTLLPPAVPQKGTLIIIFCLFVFLTSSSSFIFHVKYHIRKNLNEIFLQEGQQEEIRG